MAFIPMDCTHCPAINEPVLYRCKVCYHDGESDSIMCDECKAEHIEANFQNENDLDWEIIYPKKINVRS